MSKDLDSLMNSLKTAEGAGTFDKWKVVKGNADASGNYSFIRFQRAGATLATVKLNPDGTWEVD